MPADPAVRTVRLDKRGAPAVNLYLAPVAIAILIFLVFWPAFRFGFTNWDDLTNFVENPSFRGLLPENWRWFFTTYYMGHYQPLNWLSFATDYCLWGLSAERFHLTQIVLHALAVTCVYLLIYNLFESFAPEIGKGLRATSALFAAALFGVHPLRVESAAWLSARTDLLATIFGSLCVIAWLRWLKFSRAGWWWTSLGLFVCALLCKEMVVTIPVVFVFLMSGLSAKLEIPRLMPFFLLSIACGVNAVFAASPSLTTSATPGDRAAQMAYSYCFYVRKTLWPTGLSPFYEFPGSFGWRQPQVLLDALFVVAGAVFVFVIRNRSRGAAVALACYVILLLPVSGISPRGPQLVADRYAYIATIPLFALLAFGIARAWKSASRPLIAATVVIIAISAALTRVQLDYWSDPVKLWNRALALDSHNGTAHANLGQALETIGRDDDAIREYQTAIRIRATHPNMHRALASVFNRKGRLEEALVEYQEDIRQNPDRASSRYYLGTIYERKGQPGEAGDQYRAALNVDPNYSLAEVGLARLLLRQPDEKQAEPHLRRALELDGRNTEALELLAQICRNTGRIAESAGLYARLIAEARRRGRLDVVKELEPIRASLGAASTSAPTSP